MKLRGRQSNNIQDRRSGKTSRVKYHNAGSLDEAGKKSVAGMNKLVNDKRGNENRYKTSGKKNTDNGKVPVPEDKPNMVKAGASNPPTQKWMK